MMLMKYPNVLYIYVKHMKDPTYLSYPEMAISSRELVYYDGHECRVGDIISLQLPKPGKDELINKVLTQVPFNR